MWDKLKDWLESEEAEKELRLEDPDLFVRIIEKAAAFNKEGTLSMWTDGNELLVSEEKQANMIYHGLDRLFGTHCFGTGYYDPKEDIAQDCVDRYTGWHYVDIV